ncbi:hypothetical protein EC988_006104 [Linderina pennispora]|nr:hypothetical protein EC988_006104 [Linderina pennispora]
MNALFSTVLAAATVVALASGLEWRSMNTLRCAKFNWHTIKTRSDSLLPMAKFFLPGENAALLSQLLDGKSKLPDTPSDSFIKALPDAIPETLLNMIAGDVIGACLSGEMRVQQEP